MKKNAKKLTLAKETLRSLDEKRIGEVIGGADNTSLQYSRCPDKSCGIACTVVNC